MKIKSEQLNPIIPSGDFWNFEFDALSRQLKTISLPTILSGDNNAITLFIKTPLEYQGIDLLGTNCIVKYITDWTKNDGSENSGQIDLTNKVAEFDDYLIYTWELDTRQTLKKGSCTFSIDFLMNLEEDPYQNQTKYFITEKTEDSISYLQLTKEEVTDIEKKYWSISSSPITINIGQGSEVAKGIETTETGTEVDQDYNPLSTKAQSGLAVATAVETRVPLTRVADQSVYTQKGGGEFDVEMILLELPSNIDDAYTGYGKGYIARRNNKGRLMSTTPETEYEVANKKYVDNAVANAGGGGSIAIDQTFNPQSQNAQSGKAIDQYYGPQLLELKHKDIANLDIAIQSFPVKCFDNTGLSGYQRSEKDDTKVSLNFAEVKDDAAKNNYASFLYNPSTGKYDIENKGTYNRASGTGLNALSLGSSIAIGKRSFAAGSSNIAAEEKAFATGCDNIVAGKQSFASGYANYVESSSSAVFGQQSIVKGACSFALGLFCKALGMFSAVFGNSNVANYPNQFVIGKFNNNKTDTVFEVGYGADENNRANLFEVGKNWDTGDTFVRIGNETLTEAKTGELLSLTDKIGDIDLALTELHNYARALMEGGSSQ